VSRKWPERPNGPKIDVSGDLHLLKDELEAVARYMVERRRAMVFFSRSDGSCLRIDLVPAERANVA